MLSGVYDTFNEKWGKSSVWVISDTHFGDRDLQAGIPERPDDETLLRNINSKVGKYDTLIHLGDVGDIEYAKKLKGYKVLICGNHDKGASNYKRVIKKKIFDYDEYTKEEALAEMKRLYPNCKYEIEDGIDPCHAPFVYWQVFADNCLFDEVYTGPLIIGEKILLSHEAIDLGCMFNIHGHHHNEGSKPQHLNCCLDDTKYFPIGLNALLKSGLLSNVENIHRQTINRKI